MRNEDATASGGPPGARELLKRIPTTFDHTERLFMHGRLYKGPLKTPEVIWECKKPPRSDHSCPAWLTATEFQDHEDVARAKVKQLGELLKMSSKTGWQFNTIKKILFLFGDIFQSVFSPFLRSLTVIPPSKQGVNSIELLKICLKIFLRFQY